MASPPVGHRPRSHSLSLPLGTNGLAPRSPLLERDLLVNRNAGFDKHSRSGSYGSGLGLALEGLGVPRSRSPTSATDSTSSASEILTPASSPLRDQPVKAHERARSGYDAICESAEHAIDLDGDYETQFEGTNGGAGGGGASLYANGARWGWPSSGAAPIGQLPSRRTSAPLLSGSLPANSNFAPLSRVMSGGSGNNGFGSGAVRERDNGNTPEGLGLFRRLSVGFSSKVRRHPLHLLLDRMTDSCIVRSHERSPLHSRRPVFLLQLASSPPLPLLPSPALLLSLLRPSHPPRREKAVVD